LKKRRRSRKFWSLFGLSQIPDSNSQPLLPGSDLVKSKRRWRLPRSLPIEFYLTLAAIAVMAVAIAAIFSLIYPNNIGKTNCEAQLKATKSSKWQTNRGNLTLEPKNDILIGKYTYENINIGKVLGKITAKFKNEILYFDWQENLEITKTERKGQGALVFQNDCQEFLGNFGNTQTGFSNWQGSTNK